MVTPDSVAPPSGAVGGLRATGDGPLKRLRIKKFAVGGLITNREYRLASRGANIRFLADDSPPVLYVRYSADGRSKIRQQEFGVKRVPVRDRDAKGLVMTAKRIEFVGAAKPADRDDTLTGPPGRFSDLA